MKTTHKIRSLFAIIIAGASSMASAQVMRDGVWQGSDAQKGNPHNLDPDVLDRHPVECTAIPPLQERGVFNDASWENNVIPFTFSSNVSTANAVAMIAAMGELTRVADIKFIQRTTETDFIFIQNSTVNNSFVGRIGGGQTINIFNWNFEFIMVHELMHALGVWHEQSAVDRNDFVIILPDNIIPSRLFNFNIVSTANTTPKYDYASLMHYGTTTFSIPPGNLPTIITIDPDAQDVIGQREFISDQDEIGLEMMMGDTPPTQWLSVGSPSLQLGVFELPWSNVQAAIGAATPGTRVININPATDNVSASPGSPLVIDKFITIEGAQLTIE